MNDLFSGALSTIVEQIKAVKSDGQKVYLVGGAIRDHLLGLPVTDLDFCGDVHITKLARALADAQRSPFYMLDAERHASRVLLRQNDGSTLTLDFSALRAPTLLEDLRLRDFTVNAIAVDLDSPDVYIDPLKGGRDLQQKVLRLCSANSIADDPLRMLRLLRLAVQYGLSIDPVALAAVKHEPESLARPSMERRRDQLFKMLDLPRSALAIELVQRLKLTAWTLPGLASDTLAEQVSALKQLDQLLTWLTKDADREAGGSLTLSQVILNLGRFKPLLTDYLRTVPIEGRSNASLLKLAILLGDSGPKADDIMQWYALSLPEARLVADSVNHRLEFETYLQAAVDDRDRQIHRYFRAAGTAGINVLLLALAKAMAAGLPLSDEYAWTARLAATAELLDAWFNRYDRVVKPSRLLNGDQIIARFGIPAGPQVGDLLAALEEAQAAGEVTSSLAAEAFIAQKLSRQ